jgi:hypothetical protein
VISLLADANIQGHIARLVARMQGDYWRDFWDLLGSFAICSRSTTSAAPGGCIFPEATAHYSPSRHSFAAAATPILNGETNDCPQVREIGTEIPRCEPQVKLRVMNRDRRFVQQQRRKRVAEGHPDTTREKCEQSQGHLRAGSPSLGAGRFLESEANAHTSTTI